MSPATEWTSEVKYLKGQKAHLQVLFPREVMNLHNLTNGDGSGACCLLNYPISLPGESNRARKTLITPQIHNIPTKPKWKPCIWLHGWITSNAESAHHIQKTCVHICKNQLQDFNRAHCTAILKHIGGYFGLGLWETGLLPAYVFVYIYAPAMQGGLTSGMEGMRLIRAFLNTSSPLTKLVSSTLLSLPVSTSK